MTHNIADVKIIAEQLRWAKDKRYSTAVLLGAGMSVSAGIPDANGVIEEIKKEFPHLCKKCEDKTYHAYMKLLAPVQRKHLIGNFIEKAKINLAHLYLGGLVKEGYIDSILTTNFDPLVVRSLALYNIYPAIYDFAASRSFVAGDAARLSLFYLHGQRDGLVLLHTDEEVNSHSEKLRDIFKDSGREKCWLVIGYSGLNDPVFDRLAEIEVFQHKLFWVGYKNKEPDKHVLEKILQPKEKSGYFINGYDADSFFLELARELELPEPQIISRPFSHLKETISLIAEYRIGEKPADITKEARKWVDTAIEGFEDCKGFESIAGAGKKEIEEDELIRKTRDIWIHERYDRINIVLEDVISTGIQEATENLANALNDLGNSSCELAKKKEGEEAEKLFEHAFEQYKKALEIKPDKHEALNNWGLALSELAKKKEGDETEKLFEKAIEKYQKALEIKPELHDALNNWGLALSELAKKKEGEEAEKLFEKAIEKYQKALEIKSELHEALNNWGSALSELARKKIGEEAEKLFEKAIEKYEKALEIKPELHEALNNWGNYFGNLAKKKEGKEAEKLFEKAIEKYEKAVQIKPDKHEALNNWGWAFGELAKKKEGEEAEKLFEKAIEILMRAESIKEGSGTYNLACIYSLKGDEKESLKWLEKRLEIKPSPSRSHILSDTDLDNIKGMNEFNRILYMYRSEYLDY